MMQGYLLVEEIVNSISYGIGLVFGIVGLVLLLVQVVEVNVGMMVIVSYSLYGGSMILFFFVLMFYYVIFYQWVKIWLKKFDYCVIYLFIVGIYMLFLLVGLDLLLVCGLMIVIWSLVLFGIFFKLMIVY